MPQNNPQGYLLNDDEEFGGFSDPRAAPAGGFAATAAKVPMSRRPVETSVDRGVPSNVDAGGQPGGLLDRNPPPLPGDDTAPIDVDPVTGQPVPGGDANLPPGMRYFTPPTARPGYVDPWQPADAPAHHPRWEGFGREEFETSPVYDFLLSEGEKGIRRDAAADSGFHSGSTRKALERFRGGLAGAEFDRARKSSYEDYATEALEFDKGRLRGTQDRAAFGQDYQQAQAIEEGKRARYRENYLMNAANLDDYWNKLSGLGGTGQQVTSNLIQIGQRFLSDMAGAKIGGAAALGRGAIGAAEAGAAGGQASFNNILAGIGLVGSVLGGYFGWGK